MIAAHWVVALFVLGLGVAHIGAARPANHDLLRACGGFSDDDLAALRGGDPLSKTLSSQDRREIAIAGAIRIEVPARFFVDRLRDIETFKRSDMVLQIGRFGDPPKLEDLAPLQIEPSELRELRRCRVGNCAVKLPAGAIERFRMEVDWTAADVQVQVEHLSKRMLFENVLSYLDGGDQTLGSYHDSRRPVSPGEELRALMRNLDCTSGAHDDALRYLTEFPQKKPLGAENFVYWSKEAFGLKPVVSLTHVVIFQPPPNEPTFIASKGIYSSHYLDASLSLTWLLNATSGTVPAIDVLYVNRSRVDALGGRLGGIARGIAAGRQREGMARELRALKARLEADWQTAPDGARGVQR